MASSEVRRVLKPEDVVGPEALFGPRGDLTGTRRSPYGTARTERYSSQLTLGVLTVRTYTCLTGIHRLPAQCRIKVSSLDFPPSPPRDALHHVSGFPNCDCYHMHRRFIPCTETLPQHSRRQSSWPPCYTNYWKPFHFPGGGSMASVPRMEGKIRFAFFYQLSLRCHLNDTRQFSFPAWAWEQYPGC